MTTNREYDFVNRLTQTESIAGVTAVSSHEYSHTVLNQRNRVELEDGGYWLYQYNSRGEVMNGARYDSGDNAVSGWSFGYDFDGIGNREETRIDAVTDVTYTANTLNQYTTIAGGTTVHPTHDDDGNLTDDETQVYEWDGENRLHAIRRKSDHALIVNYTYDDQSRRVRKQTTSNAPQGEGDKVYVWDGWLNIAELAHVSGTFTPKHYYTWGLDISGSEQGAGGVGGLAMQKDVTSGEVYYTAYDGNGNVSALVKASDGTLAAQYEYDPFGNVIVSSGMYADVNRWRFSTKFADAESGFLYYGYRYYDSVNGRWLNRDPIEEQGGVNLYGFVGNNPIVRVDYLGLEDYLNGHTAAGSFSYTVTPSQDGPPEGFPFPVPLTAVGGTANTEWKIRLSFDDEKKAITMTEASCAGQYWWTNERARRHEEVHVADHLHAWGIYFRYARSMVGPCKKREGADCYNEALDKYAKAFRGIRTIVSATRHTSNDLIMKYDPPAHGEQRRLLERTRQAVRADMLAAVAKHRQCDQQFRNRGDGSVDFNEVERGLDAIIGSHFSQ